MSNNKLGGLDQLRGEKEAFQSRGGEKTTNAQKKPYKRSKNATKDKSEVNVTMEHA